MIANHLSQAEARSFFMKHGGFTYSVANALLIKALNGQEAKVDLFGFRYTARYALEGFTVEMRYACEVSDA